MCVDKTQTVTLIQDLGDIRIDLSTCLEMFGRRKNTNRRENPDTMDNQVNL